MSLQPRAQWSGDGDPVEDALARDERRDHLWAQARGARLAVLTRAVLSALDGHGCLVDPDRATPIVFSTLADNLFGNHAIDLPADLGAVPQRITR